MGTRSCRAIRGSTPSCSCSCICCLHSKFRVQYSKFQALCFRAYGRVCVCACVRACVCVCVCVYAFLCDGSSSALVFCLCLSPPHPRSLSLCVSLTGDDKVKNVAAAADLPKPLLSIAPVSLHRARREGVGGGRQDGSGQHCINASMIN